MTTAVQAAATLVARIAAGTPANVRGAHAVWVTTEVVDGEFQRFISVALNPKFRLGIPIPGKVAGWPVRRMEWPTGDDVDTIAAYEDGTRPA
jgi:hypothetical protein